MIFDILIGTLIVVAIISMCCRGDKVNRPTQTGTGTYSRQLLTHLPKLKGPKA